MKVAALVDFTEGSRMAFMQGEQMVKRFGGTLYAVHITESKHKSEEAKPHLQAFIDANNKEGVAVELIVGIGTLFEETGRQLSLIEPDLVMICTHGVKGVKQHLFGAYILRLVQSIPYASVVFQENNKFDLYKLENILFPLGPHEDFDIKIEQTTKLAKLLSAKVFIYEIQKPSVGSEPVKTQNTLKAKAYFDQHEVPYEKVSEDFETFSLGFFRQTISFANTHGIQLISLMATISKNEMMMKVADKEGFLVNESGIPIMTCNH